ncbi:asparagine synthase (glutamine-hydrolyzing) [Aureliella helgolandensis]|uniref:asparagine synthase (glutamine-hydrolyzing) n=1 Tax=Aureliella helgolandensis TaxID=2527968 RepID=A0A518GDZ2_9BACT|nr:asparagine synthase (glutamine-hydrolyzing) [Aureliella helgolandensis]QDV26813.1 Asparagine synthetase [glutamine-hydrolyzing] 1 [Aureliella helgolandensis]
MCGFVGVCSFSEDTRQWLAQLERANSLLSHRGPDDASYFESLKCSFGFRRLKIIDLSDKGRQPFSDARGVHTLVFNGEIYNYLELREELVAKGHHFETASDTEVLLKGLIEWGEDCLNKLNGMFAFCWWDSEKSQLMLARDRFGEKPLFYRRTKNGLIFASEIKGLFPLMETPAEPNQDAIYSYLEHGDLDIAPHTFFENIYSVLPAHRIVANKSGFTEAAYWKLRAYSTHHQRPSEQFRELFLSSLKLRTRSDVPVGTCLSGGLDSSAIVCGLSHLEDNKIISSTSRKTFSACYQQYDERPQIRAVVKQSKSQCFMTTPVPRGVTDLAALIGFHDEPFHSFAAFASYSVMKLASENGVKVVLNGQGADESLAGYGAYVTPYLIDTFFSRGPLQAYRAARGARAVSRSTVRSLLWDSAKLSVRSYLGPKLRDLGITGKPSQSKCYQLTQESFASTATRLQPLNLQRVNSHLKQQLQASLFIAKLPIYLRVEDRNSMANSIESRLPFLDHRLVEFVFTVPPWQFMNDGKNKRLLRDGMADILPSKVLDRKDKFGFPIPQSDWLFSLFRDEVEELLANLSTEMRSILQSDALLPLYREHIAHLHGKRDKGGPSQFWFRVISLELWFRHVELLKSYCYAT